MREVAMNIINLIDDLGALGIRTKGHCKEEFFSQKSEFTMEVGGWVGPGLTRNFFFWKSSQIALNQYWYFGVVYTMCILFEYIVKSC